MATTTMQRVRDPDGRGAAATPATIAASGWCDAAPSTLATLLRWVEASTDAVVAVDAAGRVARANAAFARAFAVTPCATGDAPERPALSRFVPLLTAPRLSRWIEESGGMRVESPRVHRLLAESVGADGDRFLSAVTLLPAPSADDDGARGAARTTCLVSLRPLDGPRGLRMPTLVDARPPADAVALAALVDASLRTLGDVGARRRCRVVLHAPDARVAADPEPLREALARVVDNACRYSPPAAPVRIASRLEAADPAEGPDAIARIVVTVADRGAGLARAHVQRAFEPFWRGPGAGRTPGHGLGLPMARELLEGQRGWIELRSAPGIGTEVELWVPAG